jgi:ankyrin repeat protein
MSAALHNQYDLALNALDNGADPNASNLPILKWDSVLDGAAYRGYKEIVELLLSRGANLYPRSAANPLLEAVKGRWVEIAQILIDRFADLNSTKKVGFYRLSPVKVAAQDGNTEMLKLLSANGADMTVISDEPMRML